MALKDRFGFRGRGPVFPGGHDAGTGPNAGTEHHASRGTTVMRTPRQWRPSDFHLGVPEGARVYNVTGDYSAGDVPVNDDILEWEAEGEEEFSPDDSINEPPSMTDPLRDRPRTHYAEYDSENRRLRITYREGAIYEYDGVDEETWQEMRSVKYSTGKWLNANLLSYNQGIRIN